MPSNFGYTSAAPDPILTDFAVQYGTGGGFIADKVAPVVMMADPYFKIPTYKNAAINDDIVAAIGPRDSANEISRYAPTFAASTSKRYALKHGITRDIKLAAPTSPLGSEQVTVEELTGKLRLGAEKRIKTLLDNAGTAASAPSVKWDASSGVIIIEKAIDDAREAFVKKCGFEANAIVIPSEVAKAMKRDATIRDLRKYTDPSLLVNGDLPANLWGLEVVIPGALANTAAPGVTQSISRVWLTDTVYLLHLNPSITGNGQAMTAAAQFRYANWGSAFQAFVWDDPDLSVKVTWVAVEVHQVEALVCTDAVYRIPDVLT